MSRDVITLLARPGLAARLRTAMRAEAERLAALVPGGVVVEDAGGMVVCSADPAVRAREHGRAGVAPRPVLAGVAADAEAAVRDAVAAELGRAMRGG